MKYMFDKELKRLSDALIDRVQYVIEEYTTVNPEMMNKLERVITQGVNDE